ncbi:hypothetical protein BC936DRAFT_148712 [Jimgerdemannia flammicorona]|uniref:Uncharacterized protein n=1 Tax=Jimgerdemannia flammicorona TaxID=994334 RepID=A0A433D2F8_9FUNG|nr:hypothetical protein BC936DRAFT_148712 [Jimgerdemannia flammicorona]
MQQTSNLIDFDDWNLTPANTGHDHSNHDRDDPTHAPMTNPAYDFTGVVTPTAVATDPFDGDDLADFLNTPTTAPDSAIAHPPAHNEFDDFAMFASSAPPGPDAEPDVVGFPVMDNVASGLRKGMDEFASFGEDDEFHVDEFGDFGERKGEEEVVASGEMKIVDQSNEGDFLGDFDEGKVEVTASAEVKVVNSSNEGEFGDFDGEVVNSSNEGEFGDFDGEKVEVKMAMSAQMEVKDVNNGDDFGDSGQEKMDVVSERVETEDASMDDDFGGLGEGKMDVVVSAEVDVVDVNNEDDFGDFDEGSVHTEARTVGVSDDDDFGDFGEGSVHVEARAADATNDDDFGDFDEGQMSLPARPRDAGNTDAEFGDFDEAAPPERELEPPKRIVPIDPVEMKSLVCIISIHYIP